jgi:hypothetical protein
MVVIPDASLPTRCPSVKLRNLIPRMSQRLLAVQQLLPFMLTHKFLEMDPTNVWKSVEGKRSTANDGIVAVDDAKVPHKS